MKKLVAVISIIVLGIGVATTPNVVQAGGKGNQSRIEVTNASELIGAFQDAQSGDIIQIAPGTYNLEGSEIPILVPGITIKGAGPIRTKIIGAIQASGEVTIKKLSLEQRGDQYGTIRVVIAGPEASNVKIHDVWLKTSCSTPSCAGTTTAIVIGGQGGGIDFQITDVNIVGDGQGTGVVIDEQFDVHRSKIRGARFSDLYAGVAFSVDKLLFEGMDEDEYRRFLEKVPHGNFFDDVQINVIQSRG